jgi:uncharacterized membrane protein YcaP (DUF421 family)
MNILSELFSLDVAKLVRAAVAVPLIYIVLIGLIRLSGKRTTSQMNNFDWIVTVALGSLVAAGITSSSASVLQVLLAITLLIGLQFAVTWLVLRSDTIRRWVKPRPRLLFYEGRFLCRDMRAERVSELEVLAAIRASGRHQLEDVGAVVLETDATLSVLPVQQPGAAETTLDDVAISTPGIRIPGPLGQAKQHSEQSR